MTEPITDFSGPYDFLSNFYPAPITYLGIRVPTTEHAYQMAKCVFPHERRTVAAALHPASAKKLGKFASRRVDWEAQKDSAMLDILRLKFADYMLRKWLLATGDAQLLEGNTWGDRYWGVVWNRQNEEWSGKNMLGKLLMQVRDECRANQS